MTSALFLLLFSISDALYTAESPVKLLSVGFFADRYPAAESEYRTEISAGEVCEILQCMIIPSSLLIRMWKLLLTLLKKQMECQINS